jgi:hypothetical protein
VVVEAEAEEEEIALERGNLGDDVCVCMFRMHLCAELCFLMITALFLPPVPSSLCPSRPLALSLPLPHQVVLGQPFHSCPRHSACMGPCREQVLTMYSAYMCMFVVC